MLIVNIFTILLVPLEVKNQSVDLKIQNIVDTDWTDNISSIHLKP